MSALRYFVLPLVFAVALSAGCDKKFVDDSKVLATVGAEAITEKDYENYLQLRHSQQGPIPDQERERKVVLDELIDRVLLTQHGAALGLEQTPDVHFRLKRVRENVLAQEVIRNALKDKPIADEELKKRFEQEIENTNKTEYKVRHILVKTEDEAKDVVSRLKAGMKFDQLAKTRSIDAESAKRGGDLGWINQGAGLVPEFFNAVTILKKGSTSDPVKSEFGWHLIKVDDTRPLKLPSYAEFMADPRAQTNLRRRIQEERIQAILKELKEKAKVKIN